jgi:OOP family OmpA-OmpF porin
MTKTSLTMVALLACAIAGCADNATSTTTTTSATLPAPNANGEYRPNWPPVGHGVERSITIQLGPDSLEHCRMVSPKFPFDSSVTYTEDRDQLSAFVRCMNHPSMLDKKVALVGRADPRGSDDYNIQLGLRRAQAIRDFLIQSGLAPDRIVALDSKGKREAKGYSPDYSFGYDRRVDVGVEGDVHVP